MDCHELCKECRLSRSLVATLLTATALLCTAPILAQQTDPFAPENERKQQAEDPFPPKNAVPLSVPADSSAERDSKERSSLPGRIGAATPVDASINLSAAVEPSLVRRGERARLIITGVLKPGFHTYPTTVRTPAQPESQLSAVVFERNPYLAPLGSIAESPWEFENFDGIGTLAVHNGQFTWTQEILVLPDATPGKLPCRFHINIQVCDASTCVQARPEFLVFINVSDAPPLRGGDNHNISAAPPVQIVSPPEESSGGGIGSSDSGGRSGFSGLLLFSIGSAVLMLFTPCVFPMIPITVSFFLKQSEKAHHNALLSAAVYSLTIIVVLSAAVLLLGGIIIKLANSAWVNLAIGAMLIFFALSLFGMYEIELPSGLARFTAAREGKGGYLGAVFMALTFTITSFTCTGPFLGPILAATKDMELDAGKLIVAALSYSATFAAPFFVLALFPRLLRSLPKSGGWLNAVKVVMGFVELALALKFFANTDIALNPGAPKFFNYETVLCAWIVLSVGCSLYLFGLFRLPHDSPVESLGVVRMVLATMFLGLALYMTPALWRVTPQGLVGKILVALLPWDDRTVDRDLTWSRNYEKAWQEAIGQGKMIFIDFTGVNCVNCRANEKNVFALPQVRKELAQYVRVQLYTDTVPDQALSRAEAARQADRNSGFQKATFGDVSNPFYAIMRPVKGQPAIVEGKLNGAVRGWTRKGKINDDQIPDFERFLTAPQAEAVTAQSMDTGPGREPPAAGGARLHNRPSDFEPRPSKLEGPGPKVVARRPQAAS
jgi:thiol:disulfide interchange protein